MSRISRTFSALFGLAVLGGCEHARRVDLPSGDSAYAVIPVMVPEGHLNLVRAGDRLIVRVLGEPELTSEHYYVDATGEVQIPLVGRIHVTKLTAAQLQEEIRRRLGERFIRDPQVAVSIAERTQTVFAVEGEVKEPGVFPARTDSSLLSAVAEAKSPTQVAKLDEVFIFRQVNGQRMGARFNLKEIRKGAAPDPQILPGDTVVVGFSGVKGAWRDLLQASPLFNFFYLLR